MQSDSLTIIAKAMSLNVTSIMLELPNKEDSYLSIIICSKIWCSKLCEQHFPLTLPHPKWWTTRRHHLGVHVTQPGGIKTHRTIAQNVSVVGWRVASQLV